MVFIICIQMSPYAHVCLLALMLSHSVSGLCQVQTDPGPPENKIKCSDLFLLFILCIQMCTNVHICLLSAQRSARVLSPLSRLKTYYNICVSYTTDLSSPLVPPLLSVCIGRISCPLLSRLSPPPPASPPPPPRRRRILYIVV